jgi:hypothetical protein
MTDQGGSFTGVRALLQRYLLPLIAPDSDLAVRVRFPNEWVVCAFCGEAGWGVHPHYGEPCPIVTSVSQSAGLKLDADRSFVARSGVQLDEMTRVMREAFLLRDEDDDGV